MAKKRNGAHRSCKRCGRLFVPRGRRTRWCSHCSQGSIPPYVPSVSTILRVSQVVRIDRIRSKVRLAQA